MAQRSSTQMLRLAVIFCLWTQVSSSYLAGIFFPSSNNILYFNTATQAIELFHSISATEQITALEFDSKGALSDGTPKVFFAVESASTSTIYSCNLQPNCSSKQIIYTHSTSVSITGIALDCERKNIFWVANNDIWKGNPDGTLGITVKTSLNKPRKIAISTQGELFVTLASKNANKAGDGLGKMFVNGSNFQLLLKNTLFNPLGICVDSNTSKLYITDSDKDSTLPKKIVTADTNGGQYSILINTNLLSPQSIAMYSQFNSTKEIYWVDSVQKSMNKYNLLGGRITLFSFNYTQAVDVALNIVTPTSTPQSSGAASPSASPNASPSTTPSTDASPSTSPGANSSPSASPIITFTPSATPSITPTYSSFCQNCNQFNASPIIEKKYDRATLIAVIVIPSALAIIGSAIFIAVCVFLIRRQKRNSNNQIPLGSPPSHTLHLTISVSSSS